MGNHIRRDMKSMVINLFKETFQLYIKIIILFISHLYGTFVMSEKRCNYL